MISRFDPDDAELALKQLFDPTISSKLRFQSAQTKFGEMLDAIEPKLTRPASRELMEGIRAFTGGPESIAKDSALQRSRDRLH